MKILYVHTWGLGDWTISLPFIQQWQKENADARIDLFCSSPALAALADATCSFDKKYVVNLNSLWKLIKTGLTIRSQQYDKIVYAAGISQSKIQWFNLLTFPKTSVWLEEMEGEIHTSKKFARLFQKMNVTPPNTVPVLQGVKQGNRKIAKIIIHPGCDARNSYRRWPPENFVNLARELSKTYDVSIILGPAEVDLTDHFAEFTIYSGLDIQQTIEKVAENDLLICSDSGLGHIAAALQLKVLSIFGPANPNHTKPLGEKVEIITPNIELSCIPCVRPGGKYGCVHQTCLKSISVEDVLNKIHST